MFENHVLSYVSCWISGSKNLIGSGESSWNEDAKIGIGFVSSSITSRENRQNAFSKKSMDSLMWTELYFTILQRRENRKKHWPTDVGKWSWICSYDGWTYIVFLFFFRRNLFFVTIILLHSSPNCIIFEHICAKLQLLTSAFSAFAQCKLGTQDS